MEVLSSGDCSGDRSGDRTEATLVALRVRSNAGVRILFLAPFSLRPHAPVCLWTDSVWLRWGLDDPLEGKWFREPGIRLKWAGPLDHQNL